MAIVIIILVALLVLGNPKKIASKVGLAGCDVMQWSNQAAEQTQRFGIPLKRVLAIIKVESCGDPDAIGSIGEVGLMQITEKALIDVNRYTQKSYTLDDLREDPNKQLFAGVAYLSWIRDIIKTRARITDPDKLMDATTKSYNIGVTTWINGFFRDPNNTLGDTYLNKVKMAEKDLFSVVSNIKYYDIDNNNTGIIPPEYQ